MGRPAATVVGRVKVTKRRRYSHGKTYGAYANDQESRSGRGDEFQGLRELRVSGAAHRGAGKT